MTGPRAPVSIETWQALMFGIIIGTNSGLTRSGPLCSSTSVSSCTLTTPPPPVFITTPTRSAFVSSIVRPASSSACLAAATANCAKRSSRRAVLWSM